MKAKEAAAACVLAHAGLIYPLLVKPGQPR
jgi:hypothetical protein